MANSVDPDEMAHYKPSHLDLHCCTGIYFGVETSIVVFRWEKKSQSVKNLIGKKYTSLCPEKAFFFFSRFEGLRKCIEVRPRQ